ncbi:MAG: hypothetical protein ACO25F_12125 [Erythrobacter sp.]
MITRLMLAAGAALATVLAASPAAACSDLPNICQQQAQHYSNMIDIAATPPWGGSGNSSSSGSSGSFYTSTGSRWTQEEWAEHIAKLRAQAEEEEAEHLRRIETDPAYGNFYKGWWVPQDEATLATGSPCILHFARKGQGVILMGPAGDYKGAFLGLYGGFVPNSRSVRTISMTLVQDAEPPQTLKVFNSRTPWMDGKLGMVFFAVPTIEAALEAMTDEMRFELRDPRTNEFLMSIKWHSGFAQRDAMRACLARQRVGGGG